MYLSAWLNRDRNRDKLGCFADLKIEGLIDEPGQVNRPVEKGKAEGKRFKVEIYFIIFSSSSSWHTGGHCRIWDLFCFA